MKCCDNCGKWLNDYMEKFRITISEVNSVATNGVFEKDMQLCDKCLVDFKTELNSLVEVFRRAEKCKIEQLKDMTEAEK